MSHRLETIDFNGVFGYYVKGEVSQEVFASCWKTYFGEELPEYLLEHLKVVWKRKIPCNNGEYGHYLWDAEPNSRGAYKVTEVLPFLLTLPEDFYTKFY